MDELSVTVLLSLFDEDLLDSPSFFVRPTDDDCLSESSEDFCDEFDDFWRDSCKVEFLRDSTERPRDESCDFRRNSCEDFDLLDFSGEELDDEKLLE